MPHHRQLAAIMFTDIEGYTAAMQENESKAIELRERHRQVIKQAHENFKRSHCSVLWGWHFKHIPECRHCSTMRHLLAAGFFSITQSSCPHWIAHWRHNFRG
jgi:hypothetical protein